MKTLPTSVVLMLVQTRQIPAPNISLETFVADASTKPRVPAAHSNTDGTRAAYFTNIATIARRIDLPDKCCLPSNNPRIPE